VGLALEHVKLGHDEVQVSVVRDTFFDLSESFFALALIDQLFRFAQ
jgi:hypothetical protein